MGPEHIGLLRCLACGEGTLASHGNPPTRLVCCGCGNAYGILNGVPRFVEPPRYTESFGLQWNIHRRTQLDSHTGLPLSRTRLFETTAWPEDLRGEKILEAGSGAGRFTEILLAGGAQVWSFDLSIAVEANYVNNGHNPNLLVFQADLVDVPVRPLSMDKVLCLGVLQHTPDPAAAFRSLTRFVRPGGELVIDVYAARLRALIGWKYALRPLTKRLDKVILYRLVAALTPRLVPLSARLRRLAGSAGG